MDSMDGFLYWNLCQELPCCCKAMGQGNMAPSYLQVRSAVTMCESEGGRKRREKEKQLREALIAGLSLDVRFHSRQ